jgi:hypothetical protein
MKQVLFTLSIALISLLTACATSQSSQQQATNIEATQTNTHESPSNSGVIVLPVKTEVLTPALIACDDYRKLDTEGQKKQYAETLQTLGKNKQDLVGRFKLACMYALPSSYIKDYVKAQTQLQLLREDQTLNDMDKAYIHQLYVFNTENLKQLQRARDDAKSLSGMAEKYDTLQKKYDENEKKLLHLKNIEKKLNVR